MPSRIPNPGRNPSSWQQYQKKLRRANARARMKRSFLKMLKYSPFAPVAALIIYGISLGLGSLSEHFSAPQVETSVHQDAAEAVPQENVLAKADIREKLGSQILSELENGRFDIDIDNQHYYVETSIDVDLQAYLAENLDTTYARDIGIVVMEPATGRILALVGYARDESEGNPCIESRFPAASIFKIVTAAAGIEKCGFSADSQFYFNGGKYTLYKSQLKDRKNRWTRRISLKDSFAQSVNPVFGKIGANYLGRDTLEEYADLFGFNRPIAFELPITPSHIQLAEESYQWAEIACGFNRETLISPMHGAMLSAAIVNQGRLVEPTIVDTITNEAGEPQYHSQRETMTYAVTPNASKTIYKLMRATVRSGTSRKAFRGQRKDRILSKLNIGGKTGSMGARKKHYIKYDWFVGFAEEKAGDQKIAVAVMVAHEQYIGRRAGVYARLAIRRYFSDQFDQKAVQIHTKNKSPKESRKPA